MSRHFAGKRIHTTLDPPEPSKKQAEGTDQENRGKQHQVFRPKRRRENMEFLLREIPEHSLPSAPIQPRDTEIQCEKYQSPRDPESAINAGKASGLDFVGGPRGRSRRFNLFNRDQATHLLRTYAMVDQKRKAGG